MKQKSNVTLKLTIHEQTFSGDDVIISNEYLDLHVGDVLEVYHPDGRFSRLLVEVKQLNSSAASPMKGTELKSYYLFKLNNELDKLTHDD